MQWLNELIEKIEQVQKPVLFWSGGLDSTVLLTILRQHSPKEFDIFQSRDMWTKEQCEYSDRLITKLDLKVFSFPPQDVHFIGQNDELTAIFDYATGVPMLKDVVEGKQCIADLPTRRMDYVPFNWDLHIVGSRSEDRHYIFPESVIPSKEWESNGNKFYAPLFDLSKADILKLAQEYEVEIPTVPMDFEICSACLKPNDTGKVMCPKEKVEIPVIDWSPAENLRLLRNRMNILTI